MQVNSGSHRCLPLLVVSVTQDVRDLREEVVNNPETPGERPVTATRDALAPYKDLNASRVWLGRRGFERCPGAATCLGLPELDEVVEEALAALV